MYASFANAPLRYIYSTSSCYCIALASQKQRFVVWIYICWLQKRLLTVLTSFPLFANATGSTGSHCRLLCSKAAAFGCFGKACTPLKRIWKAASFAIPTHDGNANSADETCALSSAVQVVYPAKQARDAEGRPIALCISLLSTSFIRRSLSTNLSTGSMK